MDIARTDHERMSDYKSKATPGYRIVSLDHAIAVLRIGYYLYVNGRLYHPKWAANWSIAQLSQQVRFGEVRVAMRADDPSRFYTTDDRPEI